jgi:hypothetical protein
MKSFSLRVCFCAAQLAVIASSQAQNPSPPQSASLSLSPAVIMVRCRAGQSTTQTLTMTNGMPDEIRFELETVDIVVNDGKRTYVRAGQIPFSIAAGTVVAPLFIAVKAGHTEAVNVTFTMPADTPQRAVVIFFRAKIAEAGNGSVGLGASLGTLVTFRLPNDSKIDAGPITTTPQTATANLMLSEELHNSGTEPVVPKGVVVVLDESGRRVDKAVFDPQRLLPGERIVFAASSGAQLKPGSYRTLSSFEWEGKVLTSAGAFSIP